MKYLLFIVFFLPLFTTAQFTQADSLRGGLNSNRNWWDVQHYDITLTPVFETEQIIAKTIITFNVIKNELPVSNESTITLQIDLQQPLEINAASIQPLSENTLQVYKIPSSDIKRNNQCYLITVPRNQINISGNTALSISYSGQPTKAKNAPWDGGLIWKQDANSKPWLSVACQGLGASVWYPCKDHQSDEPDLGATTNFIIPQDLNAIGNGQRFADTTYNDKRYISYKTSYPINNYNIVFYIGDYLTNSTIYNGKSGNLKCTYSLLRQNSTKKAYMQEQVYNMLLSFEDWFGPYPFYKDGYQIVEAPHLGMEHQSAIAYGNGYSFGYKGRDLSSSGHGKKWDYIVVHESGHEWWGNHVTTDDIADMWIHEGFTTYSEALFVESSYGKKAGYEYVKGLRKLIRGQDPLIGFYDVNNQPSSSDMYYTGANILHSIRVMLNDDDKFKNMLRDLQTRFGLQSCTSLEVENFITNYTGLNLKPYFSQYLYTNQTPILNYKFINKNQVQVSWSNCNADFEMSAIVPTAKGQNKTIWLKNNEPQIIDIDCRKKYFLKNLNDDFLIQYKEN